MIRTGQRGRKPNIAGAESSRKVLRLLMSFHHDRPTATVEQLADEIGVCEWLGWKV